MNEKRKQSIILYYLKMSSYQSFANKNASGTDVACIRHV